MNEQSAGTDSLAQRVRKRISGALSRASWALTPDGGKIAHESIQEKTRKQIGEVINATIADPAAVAALGLNLPGGAAAAAAPGADDAESKDLALVACELLSRAGILVARRAGYSERASNVVALTKDEATKIAPLAAKVIDKWMPAIAGKWAEEIALLVALGAVIAAKVQLLREVAKNDPPLANAVPVADLAKAA